MKLNQLLEVGHQKNSPEMSIDLDYAHEEGDEGPTAEEMAKTHGVKAKLKTLHGPGGGWPVWTFTGPEKKLRELYREYMGGDAHADEEFDEFFMNK